jgi:hypothetical protein
VSLRRDAVHRVAKVLDLEMPVGAERHPDVCVAKDPLDSMRIYTGTQK